MVKISNLAMNLKKNGIVIPLGDSQLSEEDWDKFLEASQNDESIQLMLRTGSLSASESVTLPDSLNALNPTEIRKILAQTKDFDILKRWLWDAHADEKFWRVRLLIRQRMSFLSMPPGWSKSEISQLEEIAPWRLKDCYRRYDMIDIPDPIEDDFKQELERIKLEKSEKKAQLHQEYKEKIKELENADISY